MGQEALESGNAERCDDNGHRNRCEAVLEEEVANASVGAVGGDFWLEQAEDFLPAGGGRSDFGDAFRSPRGPTGRQDDGKSLFGAGLSWLRLASVGLGFR